MLIPPPDSPEGLTSQCISNSNWYSFRFCLRPMTHRTRFGGERPLPLRSRAPSPPKYHAILCSYWLPFPPPCWFPFTPPLTPPFTPFARAIFGPLLGGPRHRRCCWTVILGLVHHRVYAYAPDAPVSLAKSRSACRLLIARKSLVLLSLRLESGALVLVPNCSANSGTVLVARQESKIL